MNFSNGAEVDTIELGWKRTPLKSAKKVISNGDAEKNIYFMYTTSSILERQRKNKKILQN